ncbi:MAG: aspartyl protease family protein [Gemmatimonadota bacterium]|nr:aspartyl protease family protein [Gemmatimonadota bacterium]
MRELFSLTACLVTTVLITVAPACAQGTPAVLDLIAETPFVLSPRGHILVDVALDGRDPVPFALDTGAGRTVVNQARLIDLGLEHRSSTQTVQGAHDRSALGFTDVDSLTVGGMALGAFELATMDLTHVESEDMPLFGVLGFDILSRFDLMLDLVNNTFSLYSPADSPDDCSVCQGPISVPFELAEGTHILVDLAISGQAIAAVLDTGSGRTGMNPLGARALGIELPATIPDRHGPALQVGEIMLGGKTLARDVIVGVVDLPAFKTLGLDNQPAILLGTGTLAGRRVGISYGLRRLSVT